MSYDLMVFDPAHAPRTRAAFLEWYEQHQSDEEDAPPSEDPKSLTPALQNWFAEIIRTFPPLNGPLSNDENIDHPKLTDYGLGRTYVYACFGWPEAEMAHRHVVALAAKHRVGFFNASSDEAEVWVPGPRGDLEQLPG